MSRGRPASAPSRSRFFKQRSAGEGLDRDHAQVLLLGRRQDRLGRAVPHVVGHRADVEVVAELVERLEEQLGREVAAEPGEADLALLLELVQRLDRVGHVPVAGLRRVVLGVAQQAEVDVVGLPEP